MAQSARKVVVYAFSHCETWLEDYAKSHQLPAHELTGRVAAFLLSQTSGPLLGLEHRLPTLRGQTAKGNKATRKVAVAKRPYRKARRTGAESYWAKMSPVQRKAEMQRRVLVRQRNRQKAMAA